MQMSGNTILITGGGSGIGRALAEKFQAIGNRVIISGRRTQLLDETTSANPGMESAVFDIGNANEIPSFASDLKKKYPALNVVIQNAGIMRYEKLKDGHVEDAEAIITTNLLGPIRLTAELLPALLAQPKAAIMTVSSGLAFLPLAMTPTYCATKAAIHSYTESLRYQLKDTSVQVLELIPPYVQTELTGANQASDPMAMPLNEFIVEVMNILQTSPDVTEVCVDRVKQLRFAASNGNYHGLFQELNDTMSARAQ